MFLKDSMITKFFPCISMIPSIEKNSVLIDFKYLN